MKKTLVLLISTTVLIFLGYFAYNLINQNGSIETELITFNIENINTVDKVKITDSMGNKFTLIKNGKIWTREDGDCIQQEAVAFILDAFKNIEFKGYLPENSRENTLKDLATRHIKIEIFQNGEWVKTWYMGSATQDHLGQIMLLESDEFGKSDLPVLMRIKGVYGIIEPRFYADPRKWMCTNIFALNPDDILKVDVKYIHEPFRSFTVEQKNNKINVSHLGKSLNQIDTLFAYRYLKNFEKIHFNIPNYELNKRQVDSVKNSKPFIIFKLTEKNHKTTVMKMFKLKTIESKTNDFGVVENADTDKFWCELNNGELVKCQYYALNPILMGNIYFPELNTFDPLLKK
ncbi:MAG: hypothetical protein HYR91_05390 [Flavobacteriia bacterium]|nr:hypothetical protein [Flavobacteriia bacterium]